MSRLWPRETNNHVNASTQLLQPHLQLDLYKPRVHAGVECGRSGKRKGRELSDCSTILTSQTRDLIIIPIKTMERIWLKLTDTSH